MKRHALTNLQQPAPFQPNQVGPLATQENTFLASQWQTSRSGVMLDYVSTPKLNPIVDPQCLPQQLQAPTNALSSNVLLQQQLAAALLAQSMDSTGEVSNSLCSDDLPLNGSDVLMNKMLMKLNIPPSQFGKALNFQTLDAEGSCRGVEDQGVVTMEGNEEEDGSDTLENDASFTQHSLDTSLDLEEQQQCQQQSALMSKFRQLREWQQRQQELLMTQQQSQLDLLREEQERVQRMIAKQRERQWGAATLPPKNGFANTVPEQYASPKRASGWAANTFQSFPNGMKVQLRGQMMGLLTTRGPAPLVSRLPLNSAALQNGCPVPQFPASDHTVSQQLASDGDSDVGSHHSLQEEGVYPLSDPDIGHHLAAQAPHRNGLGPGQHTGHIALGSYGDHYQQHPLPDGDLLSAQQQLQLLQEHKLLLQQQQQYSQSLSAKEQQQTLLQQQHQQQQRPPRVPLSVQQQQQIQQLVNQQQQFQNHEARFANDYINDDESDLVSASQNVSDDEVSDVKDAHTDFNHNHDALDFRESPCASRGRAEEINGVTVGKEKERDLSPDAGSESDREAYMEEESVSENEEACQCDHTEPQFDDIPVSGLGATKKTFEELLEEELRKEEERMQQGSQHSSGKPSSKKMFLKRGEGVARFNSGGHRPKSRNRTTKSGSHGVTTDQKLPRGQESGSRRSTSRPTSSGGSRSNTTSTPVRHEIASKETNMNRKLLSTSTKTISNLTQDKLQQEPMQLNGQKQQTQSAKSPSQPPQQGQRKDQQQKQPAKSLQLNKPVNGVKKMGSSSNGLSGEGVHSSNPCDRPSNGSAADSLGETSFQARLTARAEVEEEDIEQLQEFELLEQFADDNASFLSNLSAVNRAVQNNKGFQRNHQMPPINSIIKPPPVIHSPVAPSVPACTHEPSSDDDDTSLSTDFDDATSQSGSEAQHKANDTEHDNTLVESPAKEAAEDPAANPVISESTTKPLQRKVAPNRGNRLALVQVFSDSDQNQSDLSDQEKNQLQEPVDVNTSGAGREISQSNELVQTALGVPDGEVEHRRRSGESSQQQTLLPQSNTLGNHGYIETNDGDAQPVAAMIDTGHKDDLIAQKINFEDDMEAWDDSRCEDPVVVTSVASGNPLITRSILSRGIGPGDTTEKSTTPPTSHLVSKLFPKLRQEKPKPRPPPEAEQRLTAATQAEPADGVQSKLLRDKLLELEREIEKFRSENTNLVKLRKEREEGLAQLRKEMAEFDKQKNEELKRLHDFKAEEMKKLRREKKQFEQFQQNARAMPNKKEREEIEMLKTQLSDLQEEVKRKEARWNSSMARLREKSETITAENAALRDEVKVLESKRLQAWQQREAAPKCKNEASQPPPIKKSTLQPAKSPKPESQASRFAPRDSALGLSTNLDLDESDLLASEEPPPPRGTSGASPRQPEMTFTPTPFHPGPPISPPSDLSIPGDTKRQLPRKRATVPSLANTIDKGNEQYEEIAHPDGKVEKIYTNGAREILFTNGTRKQVSASGGSIIVSFFNGDMKQILPDQRIVYYYADAQITHTTYPDGLEILQFPNQQVEKHYPDGTKEITFPDQSIKYLFPNGTEESIHTDGTVIRIEKSGEKTVEFSNGQREVHTQHYKRREYPDGTVKTVYPDGKQETRYSSGRVRIKDNEGNIIVDKRIN